MLPNADLPCAGWQCAQKFSCARHAEMRPWRACCYRYCNSDALNYFIPAESISAEPSPPPSSGTVAP